MSTNSENASTLVSLVTRDSNLLLPPTESVAFFESRLDIIMLGYGNNCLVLKRFSISSYKSTLGVEENIKERRPFVECIRSGFLRSVANTISSVSAENSLLSNFILSLQWRYYYL